MDDILYSQTEAANRLGISPGTLKELAETCEITYVLQGKRRKFAPSDLQKYIENCRARAQAQIESLQRGTKKRATARQSSKVLDFKSARKKRKNT